MRLTGFVEDLTTRLKRAVLKYEHTESTLKHTQHALQAEKAASTKQSEAFKKELAISHDKEAKLCAELANRPQRSALSQSAFSQAVGTILADEQRIELHSREVQELEGKIKALGDAKVLIEAEMTGLRKLRDAAASELDSVRAQQSELCAAADESQKLIKVAEEALATIEARKKLAVDELKTTESKNTTIEREYKSVVNKMAETKGQLEALNAQITLIKEQTVEAQTAENVAKKAAAAAESTQANNEALTKKAHTAQAEALNEEIAALTKQKEEMHASIASMHASVASVQAEEMSVQKKLQETNRLVKEAIERHEAVEKQHASMTKVPDFILETDIETPTEMSVLQPCSRGPCITGHINSNIIGVGGTRSMRRAAHAALSRTLPYALIADVSVDLAAFEVDDIAGAIKSHEADDPQTQMVAAVIGDLKAALTTIVEQKVPKTRLVQAI
jgi:chromosome segregation ATPase